MPTSIPKYYQPLEVVGMGSFGIVYRVYDHLRRQVIALKQLRPVFAENADHRAMIINEFRILSRLRHPYVLPALDFGFDDDHHPYFTMPLLANAMTLHKAVVHRSFGEKVELLIQALQALTYLHQHRVIHNDLKPSNILVVENHVVLLDFGFASILGDARFRASGTLRYLAPERLRGISSTETDFFALGVIAFELFAASTALAELVEQRQPTPADVEQLPIDLQMRQIIASLLSPDPGERRLDIGALIQQYIERSGQAVSYTELALQDSFFQAAPFTGRQAELQQLRDALKTLSEQRGGLWLVHGESGIGKSRLLDELRIEALVQQTVVMRGHATKDYNRPYQWLEETLRWLRLNVNSDSKDYGILQRALLEEVDAGISSYELLDSRGEAGRYEVVELVERLLKLKTERLLIIIEDIHWLTLESVELFKALTERASQTATMFVASYRSESEHNFAEIFTRARQIDLHRLSRFQMNQLINAMIGRSADQPLLDFLEVETNGNPFFIVEVLRVLAASPNGLEQPEALAASNMVTRNSVLQQRLLSLPEWVRELLPLAAVLGYSPDIETMRTVFADVDLGYWLTLCARWYVLQAENDGWHFTHDYIRQMILQQLTPGRKRELHRLAAQTIETRTGTEAVSAAVLAFHWKEAGHAEREAFHSMRAATFAMQQGVYGEAVTHYRRALELNVASKYDAERALLENMLGEALFASGHMVEGEQHLLFALASYRVPVPDIYSISRELVRHAWHRAARVYRWERIFSEDHRARAQLIIRACEKLAQINYVRNQKQVAVYYALLGVNLAEQLGISARSEQARFYGSMALSFGLVSLHLFARFYVRQADHVSIRITADAVAWKNEAVGAYFAGCGRWEEARERFLESLQVAQEKGSKRRQLEVIGFLAAVAVLQARWEDLEVAARQFQVVDPHKDDRPARIWNLVTSGTKHLLCGNADSGELFEWIDEVEDLIGHLDDMATQIRALGFLILYYLSFNVLDVAESYAESLFRSISGTTPIAFPTLEGYISLVLFYLSKLAVQPSRQTWLQARTACQRLNIFARSFAIGKPYALLFNGWLLALSNQTSRAIQTGKRALAFAQKLRMPIAESAACGLLVYCLPPQDLHHGRFRAAIRSIQEVTGIKVNLLMPLPPSRKGMFS